MSDPVSIRFTPKNGDGIATVKACGDAARAVRGMLFLPNRVGSMIRGPNGGWDIVVPEGTYSIRPLEP